MEPLLKLAGVEIGSNEDDRHMILLYRAAGFILTTQRPCVSADTRRSK